VASASRPKVVREGRDVWSELMEAGRGIPGNGIHEDISWEWASFTEYLDAIEGRRQDHRLRAQVPTRAALSEDGGTAAVSRRRRSLE